jgi:hypothetical protein
VGHGYLQHSRDWQITREAIIRLAARFERPFTYGELNSELEEHDGLRIDGRGYAGALEAVAVHTRRNEPLWTAMVINADTGKPGERLWKANPDDGVTRTRAHSQSLGVRNGCMLNGHGASRPLVSNKSRWSNCSETRSRRCGSARTRSSSTS